jgi:hypothetical protein
VRIRVCASLLAGLLLGWAELASAHADSYLFYGSSSVGGGLVRAGLNGADVKFLLPANGTFYGGIGVDSTRQVLYFSAGGVIERADFDGAGRTLVQPHHADYIDVDAAAGRLFWSNYAGVFSAGLTPGGAVVSVPGNDVSGLSVDPVARHVYFSAEGDSFSCDLLRMNYDGTGVQVVHTVSQMQCTGQARPVAVDAVGRAVIFHSGSGEVMRLDLSTLETSPFPLPSDSGRAMEIDPSGRKLYYRGQLNAVRRIGLDLTGAEEIIATPSINRDAALFIGTPPLLVRVAPLPEGDADCPQGGVRVEAGRDSGSGAGTARDGVLHDDEVEERHFVCNGQDGTDGAPGASCTLQQTGDGSAILTCPDGTSFEVKSGQDGKDGAAGTAGADGSGCSTTGAGAGGALLLLLSLLALRGRGRASPQAASQPGR